MTPVLEISTISLLLIQYGYLSIFLGTAIGGEMLLLAVGFLSSLGYFNIYLAILIATLGVVIADTAFYLVGRTGRKHFVEKYGKYFFITPHRLERAANFFKKHEVKAILFVRFVYGLRAITLLTAGISKMKYSRFFLFNFIGTFMWALILGGLGYFFGESWSIISMYIKNIGIAISATILIVLTTLFIITLAKRKMMKKFKLNGEETERH